MLQASLPRLVGFGLFALFGLDLVQTGLQYHYAPLDAQSDAQLAAQFIEKSGVLLLAYVLVFFDTRTLPSRASRAAMKLLSWAALLAVAGYLVLTAMSVASSVHLYRNNSASLRNQYNQGVFALEQAEKKLPTLSPQQAAAILVQVAPDLRPRLVSFSAQNVTAELARQIPLRRKEIESQLEQNLATLKRDQMIFGAKYLLGGLMVALILLLVFENTRFARLEQIFAKAGGPNLKLEDQVVHSVGQAYKSMERIGNLILPDLPSFSWYRNLRRKFRRNKK